ncbi:MAG: hypothetical protein M1839_002849 [Geoglossum umbratile]|nr:MAG: hypothetical protein M1839_002849 [Geoglossum umbratile]
MSLTPLYLGEFPPPPSPSFFPSSTSPSTYTTARLRARSDPAQQLKYQGLTRQQRLLLLRSAGFQGIALPARDINGRTTVGSPRLGSQINGEEDEQTTPRGVGRTRQCTGEPTGNPLGILEEISNSAARRRKATWVGVDCSEDRTSTHSSLDNENTPPEHPGNPSGAAKMRSRGGSLTPQTPSPITKNTKRRQRRSPTFRSTYLESAQYIEHLESQLVALQTQLQSLTSPTTTKAHSAKLRALTSESRLLRQELSEWETRFNERVQQEVCGRVELEAGLRARIKTLERELDIKEGRVRELQWEVETLEGKARDAGTMEAENINLGRRVDLLTELLAQSPTKLVTEPTASPPTDGRQKKPRPRSMFPRIASSESACALPQAERCSNRDSVRSASTTSTFSQSHWSDDFEDLLHHYPSKRNRVSTDLESIFSGLSTSSSLASTQPSISRPASVVSDASINPGTWGLPAPSPLCRDRQIRSNRQGRTRRFPSGSLAPKSLILPTTSNTSSLPAPATLGVSLEFAHEMPTVRGCTSTRLSNFPFSTPRSTYRSASSWVEKETLKVLEANSMSGRSRPDTAQFNETPSPSSQLLKYQGSEVNFTQSTPAQRDSLFAEISRAEEGRLPSTPAAETSQLTTRSIGTHISPNDRAYLSTDFQDPVFVRRLGNPAVATGVGNFLWKLSAILNEAWQNPVKIARKVVSAGWSAGESKASGEMGWWLLSLLLRPIGHKGRGESAIGSEKPALLGEKCAGEFDWHDCSAEASKARRLGYLVGKDVEDKLFEGENQAGYGVTGSGHRTSSSLTVRATSTASVDTIPRSSGPIEVPSRQKLLLWIEFTIALVLAVGVAVKEGPASLLPGHATTDAGVMTDHQSTGPQNANGREDPLGRAEE